MLPAMRSRISLSDNVAADWVSQQVLSAQLGNRIAAVGIRESARHQRLGAAVAVITRGVQEYLRVVVAIEELQLHDLLGEVRIPGHRPKFTEVLQR